MLITHSGKENNLPLIKDKEVELDDLLESEEL